MSNKALTPHVPENSVYTMDEGRRKFIIAPVYTEDGENICDILLRLICAGDNP